MKWFYEIFDRLTKAATPGFIVAAFFPWVFVALLNIVIYESLVPDGRSLIGWFADLPEHLQVYVALASVMALAAVAAVSDGIVDQFIRPHRLRQYPGEKRRRRRARAAQQFDAVFLSTVSQLNEEKVALVLVKIEEARLAVHRSAILVIGIGISIALSTVELARYQPSATASLAVVVSLWIVMAGALLLAMRQVRAVTALDRLLVDWAGEKAMDNRNPSTGSENK